jgi:hypothetical protein
MFITEKPALQSIPQEQFVIFQVEKRRVHPDGHIEVGCAFYSVPHQLTGDCVDVHISSSHIKVLKHNKLLVIHKKAQPGAFQTVIEHKPPSGRQTEEELLQELLQMCEAVGNDCYQWAQKVRQDRKQLAIRCLMGIRSLTKQFDAKEVNEACSKALVINSVHYHTVKALCESETKANDMLETHEIIREISYFQEVLDNQEAGKK